MTAQINPPSDDVDVLTVPAPLSTTGGGTEATALRVTVATDSTGVLSVDDNGASLTVDGTVAVSGTVTVGSHAVTNAGTFAVQDAAAEASLSVLDDWDESDRAKVNPIVGQAGIAAGTGVDGVTVPRVTLATNVALPAGTNAIGKLAANSGVDIGDVDVTSSALPTGASTAAKQDIDAALLTTIDADTGGILTAVQLIDNAISGSEMQVDVVTMPDVTIDAGSLGTQYAEDAALGSAGTGTLVVARRDDALSTLTPVADDAVGLRVGDKGALWVQVADGSGNQVTSFGGSVAGDVAHDAVDSGNPVKHGGKASTSAPAAVADGDRVNAWLSPNGAQGSFLANVSGSLVQVAQPTDAQTNTNVLLFTEAHGMVFNGTTWDRARGDITNGLDVDVTRLPALVAGSANIGDVDVASIAAGDNNIGNVDVVSSALPTGAATSANQTTIITAVELIDDTVATLGTTTYTEATTKGITIGAVRRDADTTLVGTTNEVGPLQMDANGRLKVEAFSGETLPVSLASLPALVAGTANIGDVDVLTLPALVAGSANIGDVDVLTLPNVTLAAGTNTNEVVGDVAEDAALSGNPQRIGMRASTAIPTAMSADNDIVTPWANRNGAQVITTAPHVGLNSDPWNLVHETAQYTTTQTSTVLVTGGASEKIVVTKVQIQAGGTVAGALQLYFGTGAYSRGTSRAIFDGEFAPSATSKPGVVMDGPFIAGTNGDDLMVTTSAAINPITITIWYYVVT